MSVDPPDLDPPTSAFGPAFALLPGLMATAPSLLIATVIANARAYWGAKEMADQLRHAMESRATIEQAKGILISQSRVSADEAFELLVRASQRENRKLRDIATDIVERAQGRTA